MRRIMLGNFHRSIAEREMQKSSKIIIGLKLFVVCSLQMIEWLLSALEFLIKLKIENFQVSSSDSIIQ